MILYRCNYTCVSRYTYISGAVTSAVCTTDIAITVHQMLVLASPVAPTCCE